MSVNSKLTARSPAEGSGATVSAIGLASAATAIATLIFMANNMMDPPKSRPAGFAAGRETLPGLDRRLGGAGSDWGNRTRRRHLLHQIVVPFTLDFEVRGGAE